MWVKRLRQRTEEEGSEPLPAPPWRRKRIAMKRAALTKTTIYVCIYIYIYTCMYIYIYIYIVVLFFCPRRQSSGTPSAAARSASPSCGRKYSI